MTDRSNPNPMMRIGPVPRGGNGNGAAARRFSDGADEAINPLVRLHALLSGRYALTIVLSLVLAAAGLAVAYRLMPKKYQSAGLVRIRPSVPRILYQTDQNGVIPMFQSYMDAQVAMLQSDRVAALAMQDPQWKALNRPGATDPARLAQTLSVSHAKGSEIIQVSYDDADRAVPPVVVRAVIDAYQKIHDEREAMEGAGTLQTLEARRLKLSADQRSLGDQILQIARAFGSSDLEQLVQYKLQAINDLKTELRRVQLAIIAIQPDASSTTRPSDESAEAIAATDPMMRRLLTDRSEAAVELRLYEAQGKLNPRARQARARLDAINEQIRRYAQDVNASGIRAAAGTGLGSMSLEHLQAQQKRLEQDIQTAEGQMSDLGQKNLKIEQLKGEMADVQRSLEATKQRIDQLNVEAAASGRIEVINYGGAATTTTQSKRLAMLGLGGMLGAVLGVAVVVLIGLCDRRFRSIADASGAAGVVAAGGVRGSGRLPLLGALPSLSSHATDPELAASAASAIHRIRARLQIHGIEGDRRVLTITSPSSGDGKTSITIALGMSFAASGSRTLLIDADAVGGGLSARLLDGRAHPTADGAHNGHGTDGADAASDVAVSQPSSLVRTATAGAEDRHRLGLLDVMAGTPLEQCVWPTGTPELSVLPLGSQTVGEQMCRISPVSIRRVLQQARGQYDAVLIDTGPILGSIEASVAASEADGVVLVMARGQARSLFDLALAELESVRAHPLGVLFNRARDSDMQTYGLSSRSSISTRVSIARNGHTHVGPIASAVSDSTQLRARLGIDRAR